MEKQIHEVQAKILRELLFKSSARFSELNVVNLTNDHFTFHIGKLVEIGLVEKISGKYFLTPSGKEFANRMDTDTAKMEKQAKTAVLIVATKQRGGKIQYLVQRRLKEPYYGYHGFVSGKVRWGEKITDAVMRELEEETGYSEGEVDLVGIEHKIDLKESNILEDKYFYINKVSKVSGQFVKNFEGGTNIWMTEERIMNLKRKFDDLNDILRMIKRGRMKKFFEKEYEIGEY